MTNKLPPSVLAALKFYAKGNHILSDEGDPSHVLYSMPTFYYAGEGAGGIATFVEDGTIAKNALDEYATHLIRK